MLLNLSVLVPNSHTYMRYYVPLKNTNNVPLETKLWAVLSNRDLNGYLILQILYQSKSETTAAMKKYTRQ